MSIEEKIKEIAEYCRGQKCNACPYGEIKQARGTFRAYECKLMRFLPCEWDKIQKGAKNVYN